MQIHLDGLILHGYIDRLSLATSLDEVSAVAKDACREYGFEKVQYGVLLPVSAAQPPRLIMFGNWPDDLYQCYVGQDFLSLDPCIETAMSGVPAMTWDRLDYSASRERLAFQADMLSFGVRAGMHFGTRGPRREFSCMSYCVDQDPQKTVADMRYRLPFLHLLYTHLHQAVLRLEAQLPTGAVGLSGREMECLKWVADGKTSAEIALIMRLSEHTVIRHLANATSKLGAANRTHAVAKAFQNGIISL